MQHNIATKIREYLPEIDAKEISFDENNTQPYEKDLKQFTENIQTWSNTILEKAKLPNVAHEAIKLTKKFGLDSDVGCALRMVIELDTIRSSLEHQDAGTAALASMKLLEGVWYSSIFRDQIPGNTEKIAINVETKATASNTPTINQTKKDENKQLYQDIINDLKDKYPHCNINALRLLAATRLNVSKQELDDLDITPE